MHKWIIVFFLLAVSASLIAPKYSAGAQSTSTSNDDAIRQIHPEPYPYAKFYLGRGVDLVVSKVEFEKGVFAGEEKIRFKVWVRNICNQATAERIKISLPDIWGGRAIWIEDGIGVGATKESASYYMPVSDFRCCGTRVIVDPDETIDEIEEGNNTCNVSFSPSSDTRRETVCWHGGGHCIDPDEGPRMNEPERHRRP